MSLYEKYEKVMEEKYGGLYPNDQQNRYIRWIQHHGLSKPPEVKQERWDAIVKHLYREFSKYC
jgi:hypothetical protein